MIKKYINNPDELLNILKNNKDVSYEEKIRRKY